MTVTLILEAVAHDIYQLQSASKINAYVFGSAINSKSAWSDVDILLVCGSIADGQAARQILEPICLEFPIDITIMTVDEEAEFDFVRSEKCKWFAGFTQSDS